MFMRTKGISHSLSALLALTSMLAPQLARAAGGPAGTAPVARITTALDETRRVELRGQVNSAVRDAEDLGPADAALPANRIILLLRSSPAQEADLEQFLRNVQIRGRPDYHRWLTPRAFGRRFGVADADLKIIRNWLQARGFRLEPPLAGARAIIFSGTVGQINETFAARMHRYRWRGEAHMANSVKPSIPAALSAVVSGFASLNDFYSRPLSIRGKLSPQANLTGGAHGLAPGDYAVIYDLNAGYAKSLTGSGARIAVIGRSDVVIGSDVDGTVTGDIATYRATFGLSTTNLPTVTLAGSDPGTVTGDELESDLDLEWSGGVAPAASIKFVTAASSGATDGVMLSATYAVDNNFADIITVSYGSCEGAGTATDVSGGTTPYNQLWQQAAAQGISVFVSSGDSGAAGCDASSNASAKYGQAVNGLCSSPYSTCAGGTEFTGDLSDPGTYWNSSQSSIYVSALSYIPEAVWNQSGSDGGSELWASGGGASAYFTKPVWQLGVGVPSDGLRDVPDVAMAASSAHDPLLVYTSDGYSTTTLVGVGGTSAAAPAMAGIAALIVQQQGGRVGSFNPVLYGLSGLQAGGGPSVFHRITSGNNSVPGQTGFSASTSDPTYSQATGLGSVDAGVLIANWNDYVVSTAGIVPSFALIPASAVKTSQGTAAAVLGSATLSLPATTTWTASVGASWLTVTPTSGKGSATLTYSANNNTSTSSRTGTITVDGQILTVTQAAEIQGTLTGQATLSASTLSFGTDPVGTQSASQLLEIGDSGNASITLGSITFGGTSAVDFADLGSCAAGLVLAPGAVCYLDVTFDPQTTGAQSANIQIDITGESAASVALTGAGVQPPNTTDGPLPLWAYALLGSLMLAIARRAIRLG
ncbi:MAG: protease pro-enzyme activation domain-containing protein [Steroidobacteraceae bacterium]